MEEKNRLDYFDIAKGICFIAVVWGHFMSPYGTVLLYTFNLPTFFLISGYFLNRKKPIGEYCVKKAKQLLVPYYITGGFMILLCAILRGDVAEWTGRVIYAAGLVPEHPLMNVGFVGPIWFFWALFFALIIARVGITRVWTALVVVIAVLAGYVSSRFIWLPFEIQAGMMLSGYVYVGYLAKCLVDKVKPHISREWLWQITGLLTAAMVIIWFWYYSGEEKSVLFCINTYPRGVIDYVGPFSAMFSVILLCAFFVRYIPVVSRGLRWIGQNTLFMLCLHTVDTMFYDWDFLLHWEDAITWRTLLVILIFKFAVYIGITSLVGVVRRRD